MVTARHGLYGVTVLCYSLVGSLSPLNDLLFLLHLLFMRWHEEQDTDHEAECPYK